MIRLASGAASLVGQVRAANEDSVAVAEDLVVVADGMGGHLAGEVASADAVEVVGAAAGTRSLAALVSAIHMANRRINDRAADDDQLRGMGTTVCAVGLVDEEEGEHLAVLNVGDSRVYLLADGSLHRLTEDHSLVETLVREGRISAAEAEVHPQRNVLTRALGVEPLVVVDAWVLTPRQGDRLLLCSDGLFNELTEDRIGEILGEGDEPEVAARRLAAEADAAGGRDNVTTVVVDVLDAEAPPAPLEGRYRRIATPAVDLDDLFRDPSSDTATVPMVPVAAAPNGERADVPPDEVVDGTVQEETDVDDAPTAAAEASAAEHSRAAPAEDPDEADGAGGDPIDEVPDVHPRRSWRTPLFILAVVAVLVAAVGAAVYSTSDGWFLGTDDDGDAPVVALYRGGTASFLWFGPTLVESTDIELGELRRSDRNKVEQHRWTFDDREGAQAQITRLRQATTTTLAPQRSGTSTSTITSTSSTSTSTSTTSTTTTAPRAAPPADAPAGSGGSGPNS